MAFRIQAPHPMIQTTTYLPNPSFSDVRRMKDQVEMRRSISNIPRSYVRHSTAFQFDYQFTLTREKSLELRAFIKSYYRAMWIITDHDARQWIVSLTNNPWQFVADGRAAPVRERIGIPLSFEGTEL